MSNILTKMFSTKNQSSQIDDLALTILRTFIGFTMAFGHGLGKMPPSEQLVGGVEAMGFPAPVLFAWAASLAEFVGGILIAIGLATRPAAASLAFTMVIAAFVAHAADPFATKEMALLYLVTSLFFALKGAGNWSVDAFICKKK